ncbi:Deoxyuridine 5'-triphosphate nucleotidohydrolase [Mucinivorans hirudinis]|uniref:Deoxyuridine 5'-triphosphate nucleotidohydrolase n=1 Tax=Mucinivorans hirudinis TaxID=1433126 RepID=A0A060R898_9BACT|nr:Deoxyuridine 5'-triphosphate nucleotidohydrolase [Mucinivorans hirudinis]
MEKVKVINRSLNPLPSYSTCAAVGLDLRANLSEPIILKPLHRVLVPTGLYVEIPVGFEIQVRPRSGLAAKHGVTVLNAPGTIDPDYRGEIKVILVNLSDTDFIIENGERVAQAVLARYEQLEWQVVDNLEDSERGAGGFGSTGR